ncbi:unnamed protein product [Linum trigynum]|uniref:Uncharacterized protein n=1 Tax=Linum trigynum TaxID=586398 RepID=A0AAV2F681_9ROSI
MAKQKKRLRYQSQREESAPRSPVQSNSPSPPLVSENQEEGQGDRNTNTPVPITETPRMEQRSPVTEFEGKQSMLIRLLHIQLRTCHQRVEV